jgi:predicted NodU family carbamoyl transferase
MNGRIMQSRRSKTFSFQPAAGDAGCSLAPRTWSITKVLKEPREQQMEHAYSVPDFHPEECATV